MEQIKLQCRATKETRIIEVENILDSIEFAKEMVKEALAQGIENPKVRIYTSFNGYFTEVFTTITKKDVVKKVYGSQELTSYELETLTILNNEYAKCGINNCDYYNVFEASDSKQRRGAISSLIKKQVISKNTDTQYFNPIYPRHNYIATCEKYGLAVCDEVKSYCEA